MSDYSASFLNRIAEQTYGCVQILIKMDRSCAAFIMDNLRVSQQIGNKRS